MSRRLLFLPLLVLSACGQPQPPLPLLGGALRIEVTNAHGERLGVIEESSRIASVRSFITERRSGWQATWSGVPVSTLNAVIYENGSLALTFGIGDSFFSAQYNGTFASRPASAQEVAAFRALLASPAQRP